MTTNISSVSPTFIPCPFAKESDSVLVLKDSNAGDSVDIANGLKEILETDKTYLSRGQYNGMMNLATNLPFFLQCGGYFTFDPDISNYIGGYPRGAVLSYVAGDEFNFVVSLKDNNNDNFVNNPGYINGKSWMLTRKALIFPDYNRQFMPDGVVVNGKYESTGWGGGNKLCYYFPVPDKSTTLKLTSVRGVPVYENNDPGSGNERFNSFKRELWSKQDDTAVYFRVLGKKSTFSKVVNPPDPFEKLPAGRADMTLGGQIYLHSKGWFYLSLARITNAYVETNACGGKRYKEGTPNCACITISDDAISTIGGGTVISSSYSNNSLRHQCYGWSLQLLVRKPCYLSIWQNCPHFDMFYNYFGIKA